MSDSRLRKMEEGDLEQVLVWRNHFDIRRFMYNRHEISEAEHQRWYARANKDLAVTLLIFELQTVATGFVKFTRLSETSRTADWGFYLAPDAQPGAGRKLGCTALAYAFDKLGLHKTCGHVLAFNEKSVRFHNQLGFHQEGRLREHHFDGASYHDVIYFGLLCREWKLKKEEMS